MTMSDMIKVKDRLEKHPKDMVNIELLEQYSHYNQRVYRSEDEQNYIALLRQEMLKRMEEKNLQQTGQIVKEALRTSILIFSKMIR